MKHYHLLNELVQQQYLAIEHKRSFDHHVRKKVGALRPRNGFQLYADDAVG